MPVIHTNEKSKIYLGQSSIGSLLVGTDQKFGGTQTQQDTTYLENLIFLHHSCGRGLINVFSANDGTTETLMFSGSSIRDLIDNYNTTNGTNIEFWDHDYNYVGIRGPDGHLYPDRYGGTGQTDYGTGAANTYFPDTWTAWTSQVAPYATTRENFLNNHDLYITKSCYNNWLNPNLNLYKNRFGDPLPDNMNELEFCQSQFTELFDTWATDYSDHYFAYLTCPPRHRLHSSNTTARDASNTPRSSNSDRQRDLANWLVSQQSNYHNVFVFNLFDIWAEPDTEEEGIRNTKKTIYGGASGTDSHPNALGYSDARTPFFNWLMEIIQVPA